MLSERVSQLLRSVQTQPAARPGSAPSQPGATEGTDFAQQLLQLAKAQQEALQQGNMTEFRALAAQRAQMSVKLHRSLNAAALQVDPQLQAELQRLDQMTRQMLVRRYAAAQQPQQPRQGTSA